MLSCLGKLYESLVQKRLSWFIENSNLFPGQLMGFRPDRNTSEALLFMENEIVDALNNKEYLIATYLDIKGAFDAVHHGKLLEKCIKIGITGKMLKFLKNYLSDRTFKVIIGNDNSEPAKITKGLPQGSPLSPTLYNVMTFDMPISEDSKKQSWADDILMLTRDQKLEDLTTKTQRELDTLEAWCEENELEIATEQEKSCFSLFTRRKVENRPNLTLNNNRLPETNSKKYLGLTWDSPRLTWTAHVNNVVAETKKRLDIMKKISGSKYGATRKMLIKFYETYIVSKICYGMPLYCATNKANLKKLQVLQNSAMRIATGAFKSTPVTSLSAEAKIISIEARIELETSKLYYKTCCKHYSNPVSTVHLGNMVQNLNTKRKNFVTRAKEIITKIGEPLPPITSTLPISPIPLWYNIGDYINSNFEGEGTKTITEKRANDIFKNLQKGKYSGYVEIFTDGSKENSSQKTSGSMYAPAENLAKTWRLPDNSSITSAELFALKMAIKHAQQGNQNTVIYTDSQAATKILCTSKPKSNRRITFDIQRDLYEHNSNNAHKIHLQWIPSHKKIEGNEVADTIAKQGINLNEITFNTPDPVTKCKILKRKIHVSWLEAQKVSTSNTFYGKLNPNLETQQYLRDKTRKIDVGLTRLRFGHSRLKHHTHRLGLEENDHCRFCRQQVSETIQHTILECPRFFSEQTQLKTTMRREGIPITIQNILGSEIQDKRKSKIIAASIIKYLIRTGIIEQL